MWTSTVSWQINRYKSSQLRLVGYIIDDVIKTLTILKVKVMDFDVRHLVVNDITRHVKSPMVATWRYVVTNDGAIILLQLTFDDNNKVHVSFSYHTQKDDTLTLDQITF